MCFTAEYLQHKHDLTLSLRFSSEFLVSTKCNAIFVVASFRNSSAQFVLNLRGVLTLLSCPIVLSTL